MSQRVKLVVAHEHTLGYVYPEQPNDIWILHASVLRGATSGRLQGSIPMPQDASKVRPATLADFKAYNVNPDGYIKEGLLEPE